MTMVVLLVVLITLGFVVVASRFGADSRPRDSRGATPDWPHARHCS